MRHDHAAIPIVTLELLPDGAYALADPECLVCGERVRPRDRDVWPGAWRHDPRRFTWRRRRRPADA